MPEYYEKVGEDYKLVSSKLVLESDLIQAKKSLETERDDAKARLSEAMKAKDENLQRAINAESERDTFKGELEPLKTAATELETVKAQLQSATESGEELRTKFLTTRRQSTLEKYGIKADSEQGKKLEGMTAEQLDSFEETASLLGVQPKSSSSSNGFDRGGGDGDNSEMSARQMMEMGLNQMREAAKTGV